MTNCIFDNCSGEAVWSGVDYIKITPDGKDYIREYICEDHHNEYQVSHPDCLLVPIDIKTFGEVGAVSIAPAKTRQYTQKIIVNVD